MFGQCLLKYSSLVSLTRLESWLNVSWQLGVNALNRGVTYHCFQLGGPARFAWDVVPPGGKTSTRSGEGCCHLGLGKGSGAGGERATGVGTCSEGEAPCERLNGRDVGACPISTWWEATRVPWSSTGLAHRVV